MRAFQRDVGEDGCGAFWFDGLAEFVVVVESAGALVRLLSLFSLLHAASARIAASGSTNLVKDTASLLPSLRL
jgi:hypothetical protein